MRIVLMTTGTNNVPPITDPLTTLGHDVSTVVYDSLTPSDHDNLDKIVGKYNPDWVLYVGALPGHHGKPVPNTQQLAKLGKNHLMVHLCFDGGEPLWWPVLQDYYDNAQFALQVNIDGTRIGPIGDRGLTTLCPVNPENYFNPPWSERCISMGFRGGTHGGRNEVIKPLADKGYLTYSPRNVDEDHKPYARFLSMCKIMLNVAVSGGPAGRLHVKARTLEAGAAGCLLLETKDTPLKNWFDAGTDYLEYAFHEGAIIQADWIIGNPKEAEAMARRFHKKVVERHNPTVFWSQVMERLGFGKAKMPVRETPWEYWKLDNPKASPPPPLSYEPVLLESVFKHNLVSYKGQIYVIPQDLGSLDIHQVKWQVHPRIKACASMDEARAALAVV